MSARFIDFYSRHLPCPVIDAACPVLCEAENVLAQGDICFKVTRRVDASLLRFWQRWGYTLLCRRLPVKWRVPAVPPMERGVFDSFADADDACISADDQIIVLPRNRAYSGDRVDEEEFCRPRDAKDRANAARYLELRAKYERAQAVTRSTVEMLTRSLQMWSGIRADLAQIAERFEEVTSRLERVSPLASRGGTPDRVGG